MRPIHSSVAATAIALALFGCSSSSTPSMNNPTDSGSPSDGSPATSPPPPALHATQVDRMGRPAVNTALTAPFQADTTKQGMTKDAYNADSVVSHWSTYVTEIEGNLAILDGLDTVCGNQAAFGALGNPGYTTLATILANDQLWVDTSQSTCTTYLGVELHALGATGPDCGGRTLTENTIDETYSLLAIGKPSGVTSGITTPASAPSSTFPYMAAPH